MKLENLTNDPLVKDRIEYIFESFKSAFSNIVFVEEKSIIGIREPGKYFLCYFKKDKINNLLLVKFKAYKFPVELLCDLSTINACIKSTIDYFIQNDCSPQNKRTSTDDESADTLHKEAFPSKEPLLLTEFDNLLCNLDKKYDCATFNDCSTRVRNVFEANHISNVGTLKSYTARALLQIANFGTSCLWEMFEYLISLRTSDINGAPITDDSNRERNDLMLLYVHKANVNEYNIDTKNAYDMVLKHSDEYEDIHIELMDYLSKISRLKLDQRSQSIFKERFGFNGDIKTLQEIGDRLSLTRERIRQLINKSIRRLKSRKISDENTLRLEYDKCKAIETLENLSLGGFLAYISIKSHGLLSLQLFLHLCFNIHDKSYATRIYKDILEQQRKYEENIPLDEIALFNKKFCDLIVFDNKKFVSDEDFSHLKTERSVNDTNKDLASFSFNNEPLPCDSKLEQRILSNLLRCNTFKKIKTQSLKIPYEKKVKSKSQKIKVKSTFYYPDFQCLTHDNHLVIIEVKLPYFMGAHKDVVKFQALKDYCEKNGYGYLVVDDKNNSFFNINVANNQFNSLLFAQLQQHSTIDYATFKTIRMQCELTTIESLKILITLAKNKKLIFKASPFRITPYTD